MAKIVGVASGSIADQLGIKIDDELIAFNGTPIDDVLDYCYYDSMESFVMTVKTADEEVDFEIEKDDHELIGIDLDESMDLNPIRCKNKCSFCFVDQLPEGMRETLYVKDDDYRLSFVSGNFITLSNVCDREIERIIRLKLSPLYISVHATDPVVKTRLVANPEAGKTYEKIKHLVSNGIKVNTQIVMCPDENDGKVLERTLTDLAKLMPMVISCAVVPVGLTKHREGLYGLKEVDQNKAIESINIVEEINKKYGKLAWCSDEFYIRAGLQLPSYNDYGDFDQIENGVGLVRMFECDLNEGLDNAKRSKKIKSVSLVTGVSFAPFLSSYLTLLKDKFSGLDVDVKTVINDFFGESITVAGLITAGDIISQYKGKLKKNVILPATMLREFTTTFLDGVSIEELEGELGVKVHVAQNGEHLVRIIAGI